MVFFLLMGLVTVGCVLLITVYLVVSGIPAIRRSALSGSFLARVGFHRGGAPVRHPALHPDQRLRHAGAILLGVPVGFMTAVFLAKMAPPKLRTVVVTAVSCWRASPPWCTVWWVCWCWCPASGKIFHVPDGAGLLAAIIVLAIMILPSIINVAVTALEAVPPEYEEACLALGATATETWFRVRVPAASSGIAAGGGAGRRPRHRRGHGGDDGVRQRPNMPAACSRASAS